VRGKTIRRSSLQQHNNIKQQSINLSILFFEPQKIYSQALSGFLMMLTQNGKLLYISDNAAEYLGHSMEDLLIHGDSVYDIIDKQDYNAIQTELNRTGSHIHQSPSLHGLHHHSSVNMDGEKRMFLCRMNVSRYVNNQSFHR
jgi:light-regulated signal transduction histidine kinase (bacteriophytochrome)